jgi:hypothetical protein
LIPYNLLIEKQAGRLVAKGKRQFKNRVITEKGRRFPVVKVELAPDGFLELTLRWNSFKGERRVLPSTFIRFVLFVLLNSYKEKYLLKEEKKVFLSLKGEVPQEFFIGVEKLLSGTPQLKAIQFRKLLREAGHYG